MQKPTGLVSYEWESSSRSDRFSGGIHWLVFGTATHQKRCRSLCRRKTRSSRSSTQGANRTASWWTRERSAACVSAYTATLKSSRVCTLSAPTVSASWSRSRSLRVAAGMVRGASGAARRRRRKDPRSPWRFSVPHVTSRWTSLRRDRPGCAPTTWLWTKCSWRPWWRTARWAATCAAKEAQRAAARSAASTCASSAARLTGRVCSVLLCHSP